MFPLRALLMGTRDFFVEFVVFGGGSGGRAAYLTSRQGHAE